MPAVALLPVIRPFSFPPRCSSAAWAYWGIFGICFFFLFLSPSLLFFPRLPFHHTLAA